MPSTFGIDTIRAVTHVVVDRTLLILCRAVKHLAAEDHLINDDSYIIGQSREKA